MSPSHPKTTTSFPVFAVGDRVRHRDRRTVQHQWHGIITNLFHGTADVAWDELLQGPVEVKPPVGHAYYRFPGPDRLPVTALEPIPRQDCTIIFVDGGCCLPVEAIEFAFSRLSVCPRQVWFHCGLSSLSTLQAWAAAAGVPIQAHDDWQAMLEQGRLARWPLSALAIADGSKNETSRDILSALRQNRTTSIQIINLAPLLFALNPEQGSDSPVQAPVQVLNLKEHKPHKLHELSDRLTYIGREHQASGLSQSALHNPFRLSKISREAACDKFATQVLAPAIEARAGPVWQELERLTAALLNAIAAGEHIELLCHCAPQRCHGDAIAQALVKLALSQLGFKSPPSPQIS